VGEGKTFFRVLVSDCELSLVLDCLDKVLLACAIFSPKVWQ
jgi:hypothetical protein